MSTAIRSSLTDHSTLDGTGDEINGSEVDENGFTIADILDGTTSTDLAGAGVVDFVFTTSRSGLRLIDLDNAASAIHTALTVEWDPGDGGNLTDNGSGIGIDFIMPDDADNQDTYASINTMVVSDATTAEEGELSFKVVKAGTNTEVLTIGSGVSTFSQQITVGVNDTGHDVKFFGASAGAYMEWDESADQLRIMGASADATTSTGKLLLATSLTDINANDVLGKIDFQAPHEAGGTDAITVAASIQAIAQATFSSSVNATDLIFYTGSSEAATEKFRFTSDGELGVGGANYGTDGQVLTSTGAGTAPAWEDANAGDITSVVAGDGMTGGATSGAATVNVVGGDGITANANDVAITAAQTTVTSIYNTSLKMGRDSQNLIDFATTDDKIIFRVANVNEVEMVADVLQPTTSDGVALGTGSLMWSDLFLASGAVVNFNNGNTTLTHTNGTGLTLNSTNKLMFGDAASFVQQSADGTLRIDGEAIIDLNASTRVDVSGDLKVGGEVQTASIGYTDGDNSMTIADGGGVTFAQAVDLGSNTLTTTGSLQVRTIDYSDGDNAITIADGGGTTFPKTLHVLTASSGGSAHADADELILENSGDVGATFLSGSSSRTLFYFGDSESATASRFVWNNDLNTFSLWTSSTERLTLNSSGQIGLGQTSPAQVLDVNGSAHVANILYANESANANMTVGVTLNQGTNDNEILTLKSSDVVHKMTNNAVETDSYATFKKTSATQGGLNINSWGEADSGAGFVVNAACGEDTNDATSSVAPIYLAAFKNPDTTPGARDAVGTGANVIAIVNGGTARVIVKGDGTVHASDTSWATALDDMPDALAGRAYTTEMADRQGEGLFGGMKVRAPELVQRMEDAGIVTHAESEGEGSIPGHRFLNVQKGIKFSWDMGFQNFSFLAEIAKVLSAEQREALPAQMQQAFAQLEENKMELD